MKHSARCDFRDLIRVPAVDTGTDSRHGNRSCSQRRGDVQRAGETGCQKSGIRLPSVTIRPNRVDDPSAWKVECLGGDRLTDG